MATQKRPEWAKRTIAALERSGLAEGDLERIVGARRSWVARWLDGANVRSSCKISALIAVRNATELSMDWIVTGKETISWRDKAHVAQIRERLCREPVIDIEMARGSCAPTSKRLHNQTPRSGPPGCTAGRFCVWTGTRYDLRHVRTFHAESLMGGNPSLGRSHRTAAQSGAALQHRAHNADRGCSRLGRRQRACPDVLGHLVPSWWKKPLKELPSTFNARAETVAERPMFRLIAP
jgi:hypothetical protein